MSIPRTLAAIVIAVGLHAATAAAADSNIPARANPSSLTGPSGTLSRVLEGEFSSPTVADAHLAALRGFYRSRNFTPLWVGAGGLSDDGRTLLSALETARDGGVREIAGILGSARKAAGGSGQLAELEVLLSSALLSAAVDPDDPTGGAIRREVLASVGATREAGTLVHRYVPADIAFWRMRAAIEEYRGIAAVGGWPVVPAGPNMRSGARDSRVIALRQRLLLTADLTHVTGEETVFDPAVSQAVRGFQRRHGLAADGVVGPATLEALNASVEERLAALETNLARLHREQRARGERYLVVNLPAAAYRLVEDGQTVMEAAAIVGQPSWPTPQLDSAVDRIEFNPYWTVPPRILRLELMPKVLEDPGYPTRLGMQWIDDTYRQDPGPLNPLGAAKFLFPNRYSVYLHDTNRPELFDRPARFLSHGCIRIPNALELAAYLLKDDPSWSRSKIDEAVEGGQTVQVPLPHPIPIHLVYDTAWVDDSGIVHFRADVYGRDGQIEVATLDDCRDLARCGL